MSTLSIPRKTKSSSKLPPCPRTGASKCYCHPDLTKLRSYPSPQGRVRTSADEGNAPWPDHVIATKGYAEHLVSLSNPGDAPSKVKGVNTSSLSRSDSEVSFKALSVVTKKGEYESMRSGYFADDEKCRKSLSAEERKEEEVDEMTVAIRMRARQWEVQNRYKGNKGFRGFVRSLWKKGNK